ncbi:ABC transporter permease subunit [Alkalihalobacillus sp. LMS39]|uniref:ABC transporter permease subunit n=1 Tax=Alkalihalobacillus sp. LMS39 TaxID=2924032 RepID=UPI001FB483E3|nr:ABC transporter permease subunit [Alkalihalobacillus sp. LMS39]UOE92067.1 ABC transporter permease subunit [Alkalihalobacillus sp. LMS39]
MVIAKEVLKTLFVWFLAMVVIILFALLPRTIEVEFSEYELITSYSIPYEFYIENIKNYLNMVFFEHTLGETRFGTSVFEEVIMYGGRSSIVIAIAFLFAIVLGTAKGFFDFIVRKSKVRLLGGPTTFTLQSFPDFFVVIVFQLIMFWLISLGLPNISLFGNESWHHFLLASSLLSIFPMMYMARIVSSSLMLEEGLPYLTTARSKGLSNFFVLWKHQFTNGLIHVIPHIPTIFLYVMSNLVIIEYLMYFRGGAYRLYQALGFAEAQITGGRNRTPFNEMMFEPELVIALLAVFISFVAVIHLLCKLFMHFSPLLKGGQHE